MANYSGSCHCGAVRFSLQTETIDRGLRCNCSICVRKGALMSPEVYDVQQLRYEAEADALVCYQFGSGVAKHFFCGRCGIYPFHETLRQPGHYRVNLGCIDQLDATTLPFQVFDGKHLI
ncbi:GFA family protein [Motiliproteus sediminis]|uniref:GFA family protein n=1 Tax=Motiliproteus sediminis TaxID=1468178 RepID=UPI001AF00D7D|nr:GFA family protein [Motiliproteus sediminis]